MTNGRKRTCKTIYLPLVTLVTVVHTVGMFPVAGVKLVACVKVTVVVTNGKGTAMIDHLTIYIVAHVLAVALCCMNYWIRKGISA